MKTEPHSIIGVLGSGTMGSGIAQLAASNGHKVIVYDTNSESLKRAHSHIERLINKDVEKKKIDEFNARAILHRINFSHDGYKSLSSCNVIIEAIVEDLSAKSLAFQQIEGSVASDTIIATNTSSLSITSVAAACRNPARVVGMHFFNPVMLMQLVEIVPGIQTDPAIVTTIKNLASSWKKSPVIAKDTPGFIVNRIARPFYGEALRIYEEGIADIPTIDWAMREIGGFKMGPFELMDLIGNDVNYKVTESVFEAFYYDPRYRPSLTQKRMVEAGRLGRKTEQGYYNYSEGTSNVQPIKDHQLGNSIFLRVISMLINEACDALNLKIATAEELDIAMHKGVNYPRGLLLWADELGAEKVLNIITDLQNEYGEDRYRPSPLLRRMARDNKKFF